MFFYFVKYAVILYSKEDKEDKRFFRSLTINLKKMWN